MPPAVEKPTLEEIRAFFVAQFPQSTVDVLAIGDGTARVRQDIEDRHLRPGGTVSGPTMMTAADTAAYAALLSRIGLVALAVTSNLNISFLRRPRPGRAIVASATLLKAGRKLAFLDVRVTSEGEAGSEGNERDERDEELVAHATVTYAIPG